MCQAICYTSNMVAVTEPGYLYACPSCGIGYAARAGALLSTKVDCVICGARFMLEHRAVELVKRKGSKRAILAGQPLL